MYKNQEFYASISNVDIKKITTENSAEEESIENEIISKSSIYEMQSEKKNELEIQEEETFFSKKIEIAGLYGLILMENKF